MVKVLKSHLGPTGFVHAGTDIDIDINRHRALARNGIVPPLDGEKSPPAPAGVTHGITNADFKPRRNKITRTDDAPTIQQWIAAGYRASNYPPRGYPSISTEEEIAAAVAAEKIAAGKQGSNDASSKPDDKGGSTDK